MDKHGQHGRGKEGNQGGRNQRCASALKGPTESKTTMKRYEEDRLTMFYAAQEVLANNSLVWNTTPGMVAAKAELDARVSELEAMVELQLKDIEGHTRDKANAETAMNEKTLEVAGCVMAYAMAVGDEGLAQEMDIAPTELNELRDSEVAQRCQGVHTAATAHAAAIVDYGVSAADLTELQSLIDAYLAVVALPRTLITERKGATTEIDKLVRETMTLLKRRIDRQMRKWAKSHPLFYRHYRDARIIIDVRGKKAVLQVVNG